MPKRIIGPTLLGMAVFLSTIPGCLEIRVTTNISAEGSSERTVSFKSQTRNLPRHSYPIPADSTWASEWKETGEEEMKYEYTARKTFGTPVALVSEYDRQPDTGAVRLTVWLERHFGWFFTTIDYREVYSYRNPFRRLPASEYFTAGEIEIVRRGEKDDSLGKKVEEWDFRNAFEEFYARLIEGVGDGDAVVNAKSLTDAKAEMYRLVKSDTAKRGDVNVRNTLRLLGRALRAKDISRYEDAVGKAIADVDSMTERRKIEDRWISTLTLPGVILETNGEAVGDGEVRWEFEAVQLLVTDYPMEARSRVANVWAFVLTGLAGLLLLLPLLRRLFRRAA